jgi:hypothetical protein
MGGQVSVILFSMLRQLNASRYSLPYFVKSHEENCKQLHALGQRAPASRPTCRDRCLRHLDSVDVYFRIQGG